MGGRGGGRAWCIYMHMFSCWFRFIFSFVFVDRFICLYSISLVDIDEVELCFQDSVRMYFIVSHHVQNLADS